MRTNMFDCFGSTQKLDTTEKYFANQYKINVKIQVI